MPETLDEKIEVSIGKKHLQFYGALTGVLLSMLSFFVYRAANSIDKLAENVAEFNTYTKTNDQRIFFLEQKIDEHIKKCEPQINKNKEDLILIKSIIKL